MPGGIGAFDSLEFRSGIESRERLEMVEEDPEARDAAGEEEKLEFAGDGIADVP